MGLSENFTGPSLRTERPRLQVRIIVLSSAGNGHQQLRKAEAKYFLFTAAAALTRSVALCKGRLLPPVCGQALYTESGNPIRKSVFPMTDQVTAPFWQPHGQVSQASES